MSDNLKKIEDAKSRIAKAIRDLFVNNYGEAEADFATPGTFTALLEAYQAAEIAETFEKQSISQQKKGKWPGDVKVM